MSREIKFRAFCRGSMIKPATIQYLIHQTANTCSMKMLEDEFVFMQFTGLKDKNGVEIYEGDIISFTRTKRQGFGVEGTWMKGPVGFGNFNPDCSSISRYIGFHIGGASIENILDYDNAKVAGNIHENPELLEANQ